MSRFTTEKINDIEPYIPGEQPKGRKLVKLNTNENPYYTSRSAITAITVESLAGLNRYSDPECTELTAAIADYYGVTCENILVTNGSDEALAFAFFAYGKKGVCFADVTYGFYEVIANLYDCPIEKVRLEEDFTVDEKQYFSKNKTVVLANPNAQTGIELPLDKVEEVIKNNPNDVVIIDRAYADFGAGNVFELINKYENLLVISTFSKSRSLAGARVGYAIGNKSLIADLKKVKNSFHPYNVNSVSAALAINAIKDDEYFKSTVEKIKQNRDKLSDRLTELGFTVLPSAANFVLAKSNKIGGEDLYLKLKDMGILVRHFSDERIREFVRITVGTEEDNKMLLAAIKKIIEEKTV